MKHQVVVYPDNSITADGQAITANEAKELLDAARVPERRLARRTTEAYTAIKRKFQGVELIIFYQPNENLVHFR